MRASDSTARIRPALALFSLLAAGCHAPSDEAEATRVTLSEAEIRSSVGRILPLLQSSMQTWIEEADCTSCHHQGLGTMAVVLARERGFPVDEELSARQVETLAGKTAPGYAANLQSDGGINASFGQSYLLLALAAAGHPRDEVTDVVAYYLAGNPADEGAWLSESHRPPLEDTPVTSTALAARALRLFGPEGRQPELADKIARARTWLERVEPSTNEQRTFRLLGLHWTGARAPVVAAAAADLLREQRADGGWAQIATLASDAYATGQALVALQQVGGLATDGSAYRRGVRFLLDAQLADGTWLVETRRRDEGLPYFETGFPHKLHQFISFAASAWATMALCLTVDPMPSVVFHGPRPPRAASDGLAARMGMRPIHVAAAFGTRADLARVLEEGAGPDERGPGGVTPLMLAVHDHGKVELLLERGADPHARSETGFTPLILSGWYSGAGESMRLLLERGTDVGARAEDGSTALLLAVRTGEDEKLVRLLDAGATVGEAYPDGTTPLLYAGYLGDVESAALLLARGAEIDARSGSRTSLMLASQDGWTELVELLLARGADVHATDERGMTALTWAARVEHGHTRIVEALLAAGADPNAASSDGRTPLDWAEFFENELVAEVLRGALAR